MTYLKSYEYIDIKPNIILQLHRDLYLYSGSKTWEFLQNTR